MTSSTATQSKNEDRSACSHNNVFLPTAAFMPVCVGASPGQGGPSSVFDTVYQSFQGHAQQCHANATSACPRASSPHSPEAHPPVKITNYQQNHSTWLIRKEALLSHVLLIWVWRGQGGQPRERVCESVGHLWGPSFSHALESCGHQVPSRNSRVPTTTANSRCQNFQKYLDICKQQGSPVTDVWRGHLP